MRVLLQKSLAVMVLGCIPFLFSQARDLRTENNIGLSSVSPTEMIPAEKRALEKNQSALNNLTKAYNYESKSPWTFEVLRCPLIKKYVVLEFTSVELSEGNSKYIAILPYQNGRIQVIPLWYRGLRSFGKPYNDPHNIAIFNQMMGIEARHPSSDDEWLELAVFYLTIVGESPDVLMRSNIRERFGDINPEVITRILPKVTSTKTSIEVSFLDAAGTSKISKWDLTFDQAGSLRRISQEALEKAQLLHPQ